nr:DUF3293 domain-containing protein [Solimonas marina]
MISACNPGSVALPAADNDARHAALQRELDARAWAYADSLADADDGSWPERGYCVFDADLHDIAALAQAFGQSALVHGQLGDAPQLIWTPGPKTDR